MGTMPVLGGATGNKNPLAQNAGVPVLGNTGVANPNKGITAPGTSAAPTKNPIALATKAVANTTTAPLSGTAPQQPQTALTTTTQPTSNAPVTSTATTTNPIMAQYTPQQSGELQKQLIDIYGKGEGNQLFGLLNNLGSNDNAYMQAYAKAMAPQNAEGLATLNTTLGNSGVSANSSTAAIADADFQANVVGQESLVEQQLQQQGMQDTIGITQGLQKDAVNEVGTSWWQTAANVIEGVAGTVADFIPGAKGGGTPTQSSSNGAGGGGVSPNASIASNSNYGSTADASMGTWNSGDLPTTNPDVSTDLAESPIDSFAF